MSVDLTPATVRTRSTRPQELPVEQPSRFYLVLNRATAQDLGIALPRSVLVRADETVD